MNEAVDREALVTGVTGAILGGLTGSVWGTPRLGALAGGLHGWLAGRRRIYDWRRRLGVVAYLLDHTWALPSTMAAVTSMMFANARSRIGGHDAGFEESLSARRNRFVFRRGVVLRRGFALTVGSVITGAADDRGEITERRRRLVDRHENVHVWQSRVLGPVYPLLYGSWFVVGALVATARHLLRRLLRRPSGSVITDVDSLAYYRNPFEWHAYTCDDNWPPAGVDPGSVWKRRFPVSDRMRDAVREFAGNPTTPR